MNLLKKYDKKKITLFLIIIIFAFILFLFIFSKNSVANIYYRTYTKENGWTKWCKNSQICGTSNNISAIQIKLKSNLKGDVAFNTYYKDSNEKYLSSNKISGNKKDDIIGIRIGLTKDLGKKYNVVYRTKNKDKEWGEWVKSDTALFYSEGLSEFFPIKKIQIKIEKK
ncbi:MAG: hypothetical protein IJ105_01000 [Bacilli bacterium]|nr:hypothetical protein [Bacilli bacterium]